MDPDATLKEIRELHQRMVGGLYPPAMLQAANRLAELVEALDDWLSGGGFLPGDWARK